MHHRLPRQNGREKVFARPKGRALDRNAKIRIMAAARAWNARQRQGRQHKGPITRAAMEVLQTLLWAFHNAKSGDCFPSYESIAKKAGCSRDTVYVAIRALEAAGLLTWANCYTKIRVAIRDLFGRLDYV